MVNIYSLILIMMMMMNNNNEIENDEDGHDDLSNGKNIEWE